MDNLLLGLVAIAVLGVAAASLFVLWLMKSAKKNTETQLTPYLKKFPFADIERYRFLTMNIGLILSLALVFTAFEWKTPVSIVLPDFNVEVSTENQTEIKITRQDPPPVVQKILVNPEVIIVEDDKKIEEIQTSYETEIAPDLSNRMPVKIEQNEPAPEEAEDDFVLLPEISAEPEGGMSAFVKYLGKNIKYPRQAQKLGVEGKVYAQFTVNKDGSIADITVLKGIGAGCDEEALRVLQNAPAWKPAKQRGRPVKQRVVVPIVFTLSK